MSTIKTWDIPKMSMGVEGALLEMSTVVVGDMLSGVLLVTGVGQKVGYICKTKRCVYQLKLWISYLGPTNIQLVWKMQHVDTNFQNLRISPLKAISGDFENWYQNVSFFKSDKQNIGPKYQFH